MGGFDDYVDGGDGKPMLTTFAVDQDALAREAAEMIIAKRQGSTDRKGRAVTGGHTVHRDSVRDLRPVGESSANGEAGNSIGTSVCRECCSLADRPYTTKYALREGA